MARKTTMRREVRKAGGEYHAERYSDYYTPSSNGPKGKVDHGGPGWTLPGSAERLTLEEAYRRLADA